MNRKYEIKVTDEVQIKLNNAIEHYSTNGQSKILKEVDRLINNLSTFPLSAKKLGNIEGLEIRKAYLKPFNVFYSVNETSMVIIIYAIKHYREWYRDIY